MSDQTKIVPPPWQVLEAISNAPLPVNELTTSVGYIVGRKQICLPVGSGLQDSSTLPCRLHTMFVEVSNVYPSFSNNEQYNDGWRRARTSNPITSVMAAAGSPRTSTSILDIEIYIAYHIERITNFFFKLLDTSKIKEQLSIFKPVYVSVVYSTFIHI